MINTDYQFKITFLGNSGVGKSAILFRFADNTYYDSYISTIGVDFKIKLIPYNNKIVKLHIWDTAGQERFRTITTSYYRNTDGVILVFDVTDNKSFDQLDNWITEIKKYNTEFSMILIGNKTDKNNRCISREQAENYAKKYGINYIETSAKADNNINNAINLIVDELVKNYNNNNDFNSNLRLNTNLKINKSKCCNLY